MNSRVIETPKHNEDTCIVYNKFIMTVTLCFNFTKYDFKT